MVPVSMNQFTKTFHAYQQVVHEIDHMSDLHLDSSFYKQSMDINNYFKIKKWYDSSIGQSMVIQQLDKKRPKLLNLNQMQNRRRCTFQILGGWQGQRTSHMPPSLPPPLIFKARFEIFVTLPS